jgi:class 3 adenylate cyclase
MFTDIVDSTKLVELLGDESWENVLAWHDRTLRGCIDEHHGDEVKHEGDGFFVAFPSPASAIECATQIQQSLAEHRRDHGFAPQVRIGLHTAEATERGGDYGGKGVHTAARIGASASADEIVASQATLDGLDDRFTTSAGRALQLKGLAEPVPVATVDWR